jgi:hypothetical protein
MKSRPKIGKTFHKVRSANSGDEVGVKRRELSVRFC